MKELIAEKIGMFKGFTESGLEFKAELVAPYNAENPPRLGGFLIVNIDKERGVLGRITKFFPQGVMSTLEGDDYYAQMFRMEKDVPEDLKESKLRYNVNVKLLGSLGLEKDDKLRFSPSVRRLPHLGAWVGYPSEETLRYICSIGLDEKSETSAEIGYLASGDLVYDGTNGTKKFPVLFDMSKLLKKRTFIFARSGYGKSNLMKFLVSKLYEKNQNTGMLIFDPEGEYAFQTKSGVPGLIDIPHLKDKLVVFTNKRISNEEWKKFISGNVKLNISSFRPSDIIDIAVTKGKQDAVFANAIRGLNQVQVDWEALIELINTHRWRAPESEIQDIIGAVSERNVVVNAVKNNITPVINSIHDSDSTLLDEVKYQLSKGRIVIIDISQYSSTWGNRIIGLIINEIFNHNQNNFVAGSEEDIIKTIAVVEEAQAVLSKADEESPFIAWTKEGRKYDLGAILITQQPGSIPPEILSQGDNFFSFHLLSNFDLQALKSANSHFSDDILAHMMNEPIPGNAYFWSAPLQPFVISCYIDNFERYAEEKKSEKSKEGLIPPTQEFSNLIKSILPKLDDIVKKTIEENSNVKLYDTITLDSESIDNVIAVGLSDIKYHTAKSIEDVDLKKFAIDIAPKGYGMLNETELIKSLKRQGLLDDTIRRIIVGGKPYIVLKKDKINSKKTFDTTVLEYGKKTKKKSETREETTTKATALKKFIP